MKEIRNRCSLIYCDKQWVVYGSEKVNVQKEEFEVAILRHSNMIMFILKNPNSEDGYLSISTYDRSWSTDEISAILDSVISSKQEGKNTWILKFKSEREGYEFDLECNEFDTIEDIESYNKSL